MMWHACHSLAKQDLPLGNCPAWTAQAMVPGKHSGEHPARAKPAVKGKPSTLQALYTLHGRLRLRPACAPGRRGCDSMSWALALGHRLRGRTRGAHARCCARDGTPHQHRAISDLGAPLHPPCNAEQRFESCSRAPGRSSWFAEQSTRVSSNFRKTCAKTAEHQTVELGRRQPEYAPESTSATAARKARWGMVFSSTPGREARRHLSTWEETRVSY